MVEQSPRANTPSAPFTRRYLSVRIARLEYEGQACGEVRSEGGMFEQVGERIDGRGRGGRIERKKVKKIS